MSKSERARTHTPWYDDRIYKYFLLQHFKLVSSLLTIGLNNSHPILKKKESNGYECVGSITSYMALMLVQKRGRTNVTRAVHGTAL